MKYIVMDIEADGDPTPNYSMVSFAALVLEPSLSRGFFAEVCPISDKWNPEALAVSGYTREQTLEFEKPEIVMPRFAGWLTTIRSPKERLMFVSDNNGYDYQYINYYLRHFTGDNPFGHTSMNISCLYKGMVKDCFQTFKHLRDTRHTHDPRDDVRGNAEALLKMKAMGLIMGN
jgi:hypothetical protein